MINSIEFLGCIYKDLSMNKQITKMIKKISVIFPLCIAFVLIPFTSGWAQTASPYEIIVRFTDKAESKGILTGVPAFDTVITKYNVQKIHSIIEKKNLYIYHITCEQKLNFEEFDNLSKGNAEIIYTQPNYLNKMLSITPNDPEYYQQWGLRAIKANKAWEIEKGNEQVVIGLIDSGVDYNHPDLADNIWLNYGEIGLDNDGNDKQTNSIDDDDNGFVDDWQGWDFTDTKILDAMGDCHDRDNDPMDDLGHGTHCSGIMAAQTNNNLGVAGVTWFCKVMNIRAGFRTPSGGFLEDDDVSAGIVYAVDNGAQIISISWGDTQLSPIIRDVCQYAIDMGVVLVASAGNQAGVGLLYPATFNDVISVTAVDERRSLCTFSSYGEGLDLCAPGLNIFSTTINDDYKMESGTSMSAPFVAGATALLLSQNPFLSNGEVHQILQSSCDDLGETGYDNLFGYGIINAEKLLQLADIGYNPKAEITFPNYDDGFPYDFPIIGTAYCPDFFHYSVTYTDKPDPLESDWLDVITHNSEPEYYNQMVFDDTLATFNVQGLMDSTYYLRLSVKDINGNNFVDIIKINIDQTPPEFIDNTIGVSTRYNFDKENYYILAVTNEPVKFKASCFSSVDTFSIIENKFSQIASLKLPDNLPNGDLSFFIEITNKSGLSITSDVFQNAITIDNSSIAPRGFEKYMEYSKPAYLCPNKYDIDDNGKKELVFMELPEEGAYGSVRFCENGENGLIIRHTMPVEFQPWSIGDSNGDGKYEILGNIGDSLFIYEARTTNTFPDSLVWGGKGIGGLYGCTLQDLNGDGSDELLINTILDSQRRAYKIYTRINNTFEYKGHWLLNNTPTFFENGNALSPYIQFGYLDADSLLDILISDIDGDILIYEVKDSNFGIELVDILSIPISYAYYSAIGNLDGNNDGNEFAVGGYNEDIMNPDNQFWLYCIFESTGDDRYEMVASTEISGVSSKNGICTADLDNDGADEVIIVACPDIYVYKLSKGSTFGGQDSEFKPIWVGKSYRSFYPVSLDLNNDGIKDVAFNQKDEQDSLRLVIYHYPEDMIDVPIPQNFTAIPINKNSIRLNWRSISDIDSFKIYRTSSFDTISFSLDDTIKTFIDTSVLADSFYFYQASAKKNGIEGYKTLKKLAVPSDPPTLSNIKMTSLNSIQLNFDKSLNQSCMNLGNYEVIDIGNPESAVLLNSEKTIMLTFETVFMEEDSLFTVKIKNIEGLYHAPMSDTIASYKYEEDLIRPYITGCTLLSSKKIQIAFSETIRDTSATNKNNYQLLFPEQVGAFEITDVMHDDNNVTITLSKSLKPIGESYYIKVINIEDLAGNLILPGKNFVRISLPIKNLENIQVFPNPVLPQYDKLFFQNLPTTGKADIYIYNLAGEPVRKITIHQLSENFNKAEWNLCNSAQKKVASGIYFYLIKYSDKIKKGKIAIIR